MADATLRGVPVEPASPKEKAVLPWRGDANEVGELPGRKLVARTSGDFPALAFLFFFLASSFWRARSFCRRSADF
eukprot:CAMPEP_0167817998 /NCGR_PEP_ID=MMETSP0112_2-20121227/4547_1 /TAXON_ID=91324 /ORGANISM="Lotharella globosa, Strain CCCM811" /LENGTH=74 /DNA_ID=CAMNT_0007717907 /DNA_START=1232 /DNA_END=1456 /DNA_ORIENTATION=+